MISKKLAPGTVLANRYQIVEFVGEGGMGALYKARHLSVDRQVAVKLLLTGIGDNEAAHRRFVQEAKIAGSLSHTNVVPVYDFGETEDGIPFLIMDFLEGTTLADLLKRSRMAPPDVIDIVLQICEGLRHAHNKGLIHRDLKPSNIMLLNEGDKTLVKVMDFGIAKKVDDDAQQLTKTGEVFGSPFYMSPEQCKGLVLDSRSDIYAIGCIIFELLSGTVPLKGDNTMQTICKHLTESPPKLSSFCRVPSVLEEIVQRCLEKEPEKRFQSIGELADALRKAYVVCVNAPLTPDEDDSTKKITAPIPSASSQPTEPTALVNETPTGGKSNSGALIAVATAAAIGVACAAGIPYLLNKDAPANGGAPQVVAVTQPVRTNNGSPDPTAKPSNSESGSETATVTDTTAPREPPPSSLPASTATNAPTESPPTSSGTTPKEPKTAAVPVAVEETKKEVRKAAPAEPAIKTAAIATNAKPADKEKKVPEVTASKSEPPVTPAAKTTNPIEPQQEEEQRLLSQAKSGVSTAKDRVDGLIGGNSVWSVDWNSFDKTALEKVNYYGFDRVKEAVESICQDNIGKESLKGKLKKIVFRNVKQVSKKQISFKDGVLDLQASWSIDDWDNLPSVRDVVQTIENGL